MPDEGEKKEEASGIWSLPVRTASDQPEECAVDESSEVDVDFVRNQRLERATAQAQRDLRNSAMLQVQKVVNFKFSPIFQSLVPADKDSCVALENAAFIHPEHRCTPEKFEYRISKCSHLCFGLFCTVTAEQAKDFPIETLATARAAETGREDGSVLVLCAHLIATMGREGVVTDNDMDYPRDWKTSNVTSVPDIGHQHGARTICLHSFAVAPRLQGCGVGKLAMKTFLQVMSHQAMADRVALIAQPELIGYYMRFGFKHLGESEAQFGGGGWHNMVCPIPIPSKHL